MDDNAQFTIRTAFAVKLPCISRNTHNRILIVSIYKFFLATYCQYDIGDIKQLDLNALR